MKVSTITVVLNNKETVKDAILSVGFQDDNDIEHIIIDGKSMDGTQSVIDKYRDRLALVISERDNRIYDAMNKGLRLASGEIVSVEHCRKMIPSYASNSLFFQQQSPLFLIKV